jgi:hypothetical protein
MFCCNMSIFACPIKVKVTVGYLSSGQIRANTRIWGICPQISLFGLIYPYLPPNSTSSRRWHLNGNSYSTRCIHFSELFRFKLFKLYSNMVKCVNLIEIWFYASCFFVLGHIIFETTAQILEVEFGGKYGYMRPNKDIWGQIPQIRVFALRTSNQQWL